MNIGFLRKKFNVFVCLRLFEVIFGAFKIFLFFGILRIFKPKEEELRGLTQCLRGSLMMALHM